MSLYAIGFDFGNSETCVVAQNESGAQWSATLPSATALGSLRDLADMRSAMDDTLVERPAAALKKGEYVLGIGGSEYFVGDLALTQSRDGSTSRGDISRYYSERALHLLLAASAALIPDREYQLLVVTGLPVETYGNADIRRRVKVALEGEHTFTFNGVPRRCVVKVGKTIMEGAGALIAHGATGSVLQGCIDVGGRTTDLFAAEGQTPLLHMCKGKALGVEAAADIISAKMQGRYGRPLKSHELRSILRAYGEQKALPVIYAGGEPVNRAELLGWVRAAVSTVGREIASFVATAWNGSERGDVAGDVAHIILVGGGAYYFAKELQERIAHLSVAYDAECANAVGYCALARQLVQRSASASASLSAVQPTQSMPAIRS